IRVRPPPLRVTAFSRFCMSYLLGEDKAGSGIRIGRRGRRVRLGLPEPLPPPKSLPASARITFVRDGPRPRRPGPQRRRPRRVPVIRSTTTPPLPCPTTPPPPTPPPPT